MTSNDSVGDGAQDDSKDDAGPVITVTNAGAPVPDDDVSDLSDDDGDKTRCWVSRVCHSCSQHLCLVTAGSLCSAVTILIIINIVFGFDPFLIILMFSLIFLLMTLLTG